MTILILGASARAAAQSALRAGLIPAGGDLFGDRDLAAIGPCWRVDRRAYPEGLEAIASQAPPSPWLYTGALENHPELVDRIASVRPLWGNPGATLRAVRDPFLVASALRRAGLPGPDVRATPGGLPRDGSWLIKPLESAGGLGIRPLSSAEGPTPSPSYYQERIVGPSLAAIFVGRQSGATLLGVSRQEIGRPGGDFHYLGSLGPWPIARPERARVWEMGRVLASAFRLIGLFGVDFILRDGLPWPVEVNPRYTASVEVLELALGRPFLADHARAFDPEAAGALVPMSAPRGGRPAFVGKAILHAPIPCGFPSSLPRWTPETLGFAVPRCADVPQPGTRFVDGEPVMTVFARGSTLEGCRRRLERRLAGWVSRLGRTGD